MRNAEYWRGRFAILEEAAHRDADICISDLEAWYREAVLTVQADIERWYGRFAVNNNISLTEARKMLTSGQLEEFLWSVEKYIEVGEKAGLSSEWIKKLENASARFHISRLESVQLQIQQQIELLFGNQLDSIDELLRKVISNGYTKSIYEVQKGVGVGWDITALNQRKIDTLLSKPWTGDDKTFRDRCWEHKANLVSGVQKCLIQGLLRGDSVQKTTDAIKKQFNVTRYKAGRLARTETTYFNAVAARESYKELGVEMVEIIETLDNRTCEICAPLDGTLIPLSQFEPGVTVPPFHPNCRGTTAPAIDDDIIGERAARGEDGKAYYVPSNMKYADWEKTFVDGGPKEGLTTAKVDDTIRAKMVENEGNGVQTVGHIDIEKYRCITDDITTDEVVITPERIQHIDEHHPGAYDRIKDYLQRALDDPDYILEDKKNPNTGIILKLIEENGTRLQMVLRVHTSADPDGFKNSIISGWDISESRWKNYVKNKKILYKKE